MLRLAIVQFRPRKGAYAENLAQLEASLREVAAVDHPPDLVVLPETALSGYFLEGGVREQARTAEQVAADVAAVHRASGAPPLDLALGFYELWQNCHYNSCLYLSLGGDTPVIRHVHRKVFLPTYGVFDEERFVESGAEVRAFDTVWGRAAMLVCEDAWHSLMPTLAALDGAQVLLVVSATPARGLDSPEAPANLERWERLASDAAAEHGIYVVVAQLVGFEGGKAFAGGSVVAGPTGRVLSRGPLFEPGVIRVDLDFEEITRARADQPLLADLRSRLPRLLAELGRAPTVAAADGHVGAALGRPGASARRHHAASRRPAHDRPRARPAVARGVPAATRSGAGAGFDGVVIGLSGGVDSAVVAYLAAEALGKEQVTAVRMPYRTSSPDSLAHAQLVIEALGIRSRTVDICGGVDGLATAIGRRPRRRRARQRHGADADDHAVRPVRPPPRASARHRQQDRAPASATSPGTPTTHRRSIRSAISSRPRSGRWPGTSASRPSSSTSRPAPTWSQGQTDEGDFGITLREGRLAFCTGSCPAIDRSSSSSLGYTAEEVARVRSRLEGTHWKRRLPTVAMLSQTAIGEYYLRPVDY